MKIHHKGREADKALLHSSEHHWRKLKMEEDGIESLEEKGLRRGRFIKAVRAVLFHIKLRRRDREKGIGSGSVRRSSSIFRKQNQGNIESKSDLPKSASTRSTSPSIFSSSSSSSSSSAYASARLSFQWSEPITSVSSVMVNINNPNPTTPKQSSFKEQSSSSDEKQVMSGASIMIGLVLILMSFGLTILWGKVSAIAFNAMWLALVRKNGA